MKMKTTQFVIFASWEAKKNPRKFINFWVLDKEVIKGNNEDPGATY